MTPSALLQSIARATGESVRRLQRLGFRLVDIARAAPMEAELPAGPAGTDLPTSAARKDRSRPGSAASVSPAPQPKKLSENADYPLYGPCFESQRPSLWRR